MRLTENFRGRGVLLVALLLSLGIHAGLFVFFSVVSLAGGSQRSSSRPAAVTAAQIKQIVNTPQVIPKPDIKHIELERNSSGRNFAVDALSRKSSAYAPEIEKTSDITANNDAFSESFNMPSGTDFFGSKTQLRKICYVVDASGSMQGSLGLVKKQLLGSINKLEPDQYFYIIFFHGDSLKEIGEGKMIRATPRSKLKAADFINSLYFEGPTNALNAMKRAMAIKDSAGKSPELIYFLSDGFDLGADDYTDFAGMIESVRKKLAPSTRINTIGFWIGEHDRKILDSISRASGGEFVNVE